MDHFDVGDFGADPAYEHASHDPYGSPDVHDHLGAEHPDHDATVTSWEVDRDGDGRPDEWDYDTNGDGRPDETRLDTDGSGDWDERQVDRNFDGRVDMDVRWLDRPGLSIRYDDDYDGYYDRISVNFEGHDHERHIHEPVGDQVALKHRH
jgi:hypothetical protein